MKEFSLKEIIRTIPDWPKKGIMFRDITTLLKDAKAFHYVIESLAERYSFMKIDSVVGIESRGFILGGALAHCLKRGFVPVRKPGKLPHKTDKVEYSLEYGKDALEIHLDAIQPNERVLIIDDLLATGGTCKAAIDLVEKRGGKVVECAFVIELPDLKGKEKLRGYNIHSLVKFEGE